MKHKTILLLLLMLAGFLTSLAAQNDTPESELISMTADRKFDDALTIFEQYLKRHENKIIINWTNYTGNIGVDIDKIQWKAAFLSILSVNQFTFQDTGNAWIIIPTPNRIQTMSEEEAALAKHQSETQIDEVLIEVTFFEADSKALDEVGVDWTTIGDGKVKFTASLKNSTRVTQSVLDATFEDTYDTGSGTIDLDVLFRVFESLDKGHVISRPQVTVASGEEGVIHDGEKFSIKTKDDAGNTTDTFFDTGTIVKVTPEVMTDIDGVKFIKLKVEAQRSSAEPSAVSTVVKISETNTIKNLYNGEEAVISGLSVKEKQEVRVGLPFIKDLPWWVFGLKYLFGYTSETVSQKELLIIMKGTILDPLPERMAGKTLLEQDVKNLRKQLPAMEKKLVEKTDETGSTSSGKTE